MEHRSVLQSGFEALVRGGDACQAWLLLVMRLIWGCLFVRSGWLKLVHAEQAVTYFERWGISFPAFSLYVVSVVHLVGGVCLVVGLASRLMSIPLAVTMLVAYLTAHANAFWNIFQDPEGFFTALPFPFLLTNLIVIAFGPGWLSVDHWLESRWHRSTAVS